MSAPTGLDKLTVEEFTGRFRDSMIPLSNTFSYFPAAPLGEDEIKEYLADPVAAIPPGICATLPKVLIGLVPYLEKANGREKERGTKAADLVSFEKPPGSRQAWASQTTLLGEASLVFAIKDRHVADYHHAFYNAVAALFAESASEEHQNQYAGLLREELSSRVHGEVDKQAWHLKQALIRRQTNVRRETKLFREYARQSLIDTMTLYLHGICCDIDVETGPRQLPSRYLRKRLLLLEELYPPPDGYAVFPEELK